MIVTFEIAFVKKTSLYTYNVLLLNVENVQPLSMYCFYNIVYFFGVVENEKNKFTYNLNIS